MSFTELLYACEIPSLVLSEFIAKPPQEIRIKVFQVDVYCHSTLTKSVIAFIGRPTMYLRLKARNQQANRHRKQPLTKRHNALSIIKNHACSKLFT